MTRKTISFHVSSATATDHGDGSFSIDLVPELDVGPGRAYRLPAQSLHSQLLRKRQQRLYDNATVALTIGSGNLSAP